MKRNNRINNTTSRVNTRTTNILAKIESKLANVISKKKPQQKKRIPKKKNKIPQRNDILSALSAPAQKLAIAAANPFHENARGVYLANEHAKPSVKTSSSTRFIVTGTVGQKVLLLICPSLVSDQYSVLQVKLGTADYTKTLNQVITGTVTGHTLPHMYGLSAVQSDQTLGVRGAAFGLRIKYTGHTLTKGGSWSFLKLSDYTPLIAPSSQNGLGTIFDQLDTWQSVINYIASSRLTRVCSLNESISQEFSLLARPDAKYDFRDQTQYPMITCKDESESFGEMSIASYFAVHGGVWAIAAFDITDANQQFTVQMIGHMEQKSASLYNLHTPSPSHVQHHATVHQAVDRAHESHNDQPEKPLLNHVFDTIKTEARDVAIRSGRNLLANVMSEVRKPSNWEAVGVGALSLI